MSVQISTDTLIGIIALILSIIGIYYTYKSVRAPTVLEARKTHSKELRDFLKVWYDKLPLFQSAIETKATPTKPQPIMYSHIELDWRYQDILRNHLPRGYEKFPNKWEDYKKAIVDYDNARYQLHEKIKADIVNQTGLGYDPTWVHKHTISENVVEIVYKQCVSWIRDGKLLFNKDDHKFSMEGDSIWFGGSGLVKGTIEERNRVKEVVEKMIFEKNYLEKYRTDIHKIVEAERELECMREEIKNMLEKLIGYPLLPGTKCEVLRSI